MKRMVRLVGIMGVGLLAWGGLCAPASAVILGEPGYYGVIQIGQAPPPQLFSPQPVWVMPGPVGMAPPPPLYLRVPPRIRNHWPRFCAQYQACGRPVYFVRDAWYQRVFVPYFREHPEFWPREGGWREPWHGEGEHWREGEHRGEGEHWHERDGEREHH